jgi:hypothetical protein
MIITTNNRPRPLACLADLPAKVQADFDYVKEGAEYRFVQYKGHWYDVYDSQSIIRELGFDQFKGWDSIVSESFFSGILFRLVGGDEVIVGRYCA